jgi:hypothetical protein
MATGGTEPTEPTAIPPDTKDWTWVLHRPCPDCGADVASVPPQRVAAHLREATAPWSTVLARPGAATRPDPGTWSPLEYAAHVRDVLRNADARLRLLLAEDDPVFPDWDQDVTARAERYGEQDPERVAAEVAEATAVVTALLDGVEGGAWQRRGRRSNGSAFTVATLAQYVLHDVVHHVGDVGA